MLRQRRGRRADHLLRHLRWVWDGTPLAGRRVLVRRNHGLGDTLQFARLIPALVEIARHVTVEAQPALLPLLASVPGVRALVRLDAPVPPCDVEIELMEVAYALRLTLDRLPGDVPYLAAPSTARAAEVGGFRLGVVWAAGTWRPERSVPFALIERLAALPGVQLASLQRGPAAGEVERSTLRAHRDAGDRRAKHCRDRGADQAARPHAHRRHDGGPPRRRARRTSMDVAPRRSRLALDARAA